MPDPMARDYFISRAGADKELAKRIAAIIREAGFTTWVQDEDFGGASFLARMQQGFNSGARTIALLSPAYQASEACRKEYSVALSGDPLNLQQRLIVLRVADCVPGGMLGHLAYTDLVPILAQSDPAQRKDLLRRAIRLAIGAEPGESGADGPKGKIFINYRRGDDPGFTTALYMYLEAEFDAARLFMDVEGHIKPGDDFMEVIRAQVAGCDVLLAVIGPRWAELLAARTGGSHDFVAIEIKAALEQGKRVIPVLVGGAGFPSVDIIPETIRPLARKHAIGLRPERFKADCQGLANALKEVFVVAEAEREATTEAERQAAEEARKRRESEEEARAAEIERAARERVLAGLTPGEIRKAEELANWDFIKDRQNVADFRDHLARFAEGSTERYARAKLEALVWANPTTQANIEALSAFLDEFPKGDNVEAAKGQLQVLQRAREAARLAEENKRAETERLAEEAREKRKEPQTLFKLWLDLAYGRKD